MTNRILILALAIIAGAVGCLVNAQTIKGPGDAEINFIIKCNWHTNPRCSTDTLLIVNKSDKFGIREIVLDIPNFAPITTWIPPSSEKRFTIPRIEQSKVESVKTTAVIHTALKTREADRD